MVEQLRVAAAHSDVKTAEIHLKSRLIPISIAQITMSKSGQKPSTV
jgi:hypothetical protein